MAFERKSLREPVPSRYPQYLRRQLRSLGIGVVLIGVACCAGMAGLSRVCRAVVDRFL